MLSAAAELLSEVSYDEFSIEEVAARAGVHKTTVYRRWPSKAALTADAASMHSIVAVPIPDTGTFVDDLRTFLYDIVSSIGADPGAKRARSVTAASAASSELATTMQAYWAERLAMASVIVERGIDRGEIAASTDPKLLIETVTGPLWFRLLATGEPVTTEYADSVVDLVTNGALRPR